jgi:hypothetical protein
MRKEEQWEELRQELQHDNNSLLPLHPHSENLLLMKKVKDILRAFHILGFYVVACGPVGMGSERSKVHSPTDHE